MNDLFPNYPSPWLVLIASYRLRFKPQAENEDEKENLTLTQRETQLSNSWLNTVVTKRKILGYEVQLSFHLQCLKKGKRKREGKEMGCFFCSRTAWFQRVKTLNIKACFGLRGERKEEVGEAARTYSQWSLQRIWAKENKTGTVWKRMGEKEERKRRSFYFRERNMNLTESY